MTDQFGRNINYLRISITDRCNLRCFYCMPQQPEQLCHRDILRYEEITRIAAQAASLGITKIRITGGEPLVRKDCAQLVAMLKQIKGIRTVAMTTNGTLLEQALPELCEAGLDAVNISIDTLQEAGWHRITGSDGNMPNWPDVLEKCIEVGLKTKVNAVLMQETREEWTQLAALAEHLPVDVRFIEQMPIGQGKISEYNTAQAVLQQLNKQWPDLQPAEERGQNSPARYYRSKKLTGRIGMIASLSNPFCSTCNRIRLTSTGQLKPCLSYGQHTDLRTLLRSGASDETLRSALRECIYTKPRQHCFAEQTAQAEQQTMNRIGG
ncbi:GTP 3',8-cyclase MoaA [Butyricicoccus sp.]|uniref:GTP 3',8-cyclase MoaA n=1 Tax=Butyricicoccus sp. TaxID=2049021 RepID=UPI003F13B263